MWEQNLGIKVNVQIKHEGYIEAINSGVPEISGVSLSSDMNDPDDSFHAFYSTDENNTGRFSDPVFDELIDRAASITNPAERQALYVEAERLLCETDAALIPIHHSIWQR